MRDVITDHAFFEHCLKDEYDKGYADGKDDVLDKIRAEIEQLPTKNWDGSRTSCPDIDYPEIEYVDVTKNKLLSIIDNYRKEQTKE